MAAKKTLLYSLRHCPARGLHWKLERDCLVENADRWVEVFTADEPLVVFRCFEVPSPKVLKRDRDLYFAAVHK